MTKTLIEFSRLIEDIIINTKLNVGLFELRRDYDQLVVICKSRFSHLTAFCRTEEKKEKAGFELFVKRRLLQLLIWQREAIAESIDVLECDIQSA